MFALRIVQESRKTADAPFEQAIENFELGKSYAVLTKGKTKEFEERIAEKHTGTDTSGIYGIVCGENGWDFFLCDPTELKENTYFVMADSGKTYERL